jgi:methionyl-tRNA formyltransferase
MRIVFMGTPEFATYALRALGAAGHDIVCVYSQPPRPAGRGYELKKSPVHLLAESLGLEVRTPLSLKAADEQQAFSSLNADAAVVVAYGLLLPKTVLAAPRFGCFNIHASLLPRWRGAAPIQRAIMAGDAETGITIMRMEEGLDTGPMVRVERVAIAPQDTAATLHETLAGMGAHLIVEALQEPQHPGTPQPADGVTYARKIDKAESRIDFARPAAEVRNHIHGLSPFPGAWTMVGGTRLKILTAEVITADGPPGTALDDALTIACKPGAIRCLTVQREGKGVMPAEAALRGLPVPKGTRLT